ncbi:hypothetical protein AB0P16_04850 [Dietzia maris]|uniref:hypothetical protein n=1 Tax=Dietzia maris TaxID=37915 RepID=UPI0034436F5B
MKQLLGAPVELERSTAPLPGQWVVLFKNGMGVQLYKSGNRASWFNKFRLGSMTVAPLDTSYFPLSWDLSGIAIGPDHFLSGLTLEVTVALQPHGNEDELLSLLGSRGDSFSWTLLQALQKRVNNYVREVLSTAVPEKVYRQGIEDFLFPHKGPGFVDPMFALDGARVPSVDWPQSLIDRMSFADVRESDEIHAEHSLRRVSIDAEIEFARVIKSERVRMESLRIKAAEELAEIESILNRAKVSGLPPSAFPGPFRDHSDRELELVNKLLESPFSARRPEVISAALTRLQGGTVEDPQLDRLSMRTLDAIDPNFEISAAVSAEADESQTMDLLAGATFRVDPPVLREIWDEVGGTGLLAATYAETLDRITVVFVSSDQAELPTGLRSEVERTLGDDLPRGAVEIVHAAADNPADALTRLFEQKVGAEVTTTFNAVIREDGSREVRARMSGRASAVTTGFTVLQDESDPWIPAVEKTFGSVIRLSR